MAIAPVYDEALSKVFANWTLLNIAVDQGWGGRNSREKRFQLQAEIAEYLAAGARKKRPPSHENVDDVQAFADFIFERVGSHFSCEADDGSDTDVATVCLRLFNTCRAGDTSFAQDFLSSCPSAPADVSKCKGIDMREYATEEDEMMDKMQGMDLDSGMRDPAAIAEDDDEDDDMEEDDDQRPHGVTDNGVQDVSAETQRQRREEPEVDEDGFVSVVKGHRRPKAR
jgi:pre-rRNA-processing protein TSR2